MVIGAKVYLGNFKGSKIVKNEFDFGTEDSALKIATMRDKFVFVLTGNSDFPFHRVVLAKDKDGYIAKSDRFIPQFSSTQDLWKVRIIGTYGQNYFYAVVYHECLLCSGNQRILTQKKLNLSMKSK
jgi:hypothetical protein